MVERWAKVRLWVALGCPPTALAATIMVPSGLESIEEAIAVAAPGDTVLVAPGTYVPGDTAGISFQGKAITLLSEAGPSVTIIDAMGGGRGIRFEDGEDAESMLMGFTLTGGRSERGGGIYCRRSSPTITNCSIQGNTADGQDHRGGGFYLSEASPTIENCTIEGNTAVGVDGHGGGVYAQGSSAIFRNCTITANVARSENAHGGGLFFTQSSPALEDCTIEENSAYSSGGVFFGDSFATIARTSISNNVADKGGGVRATTGGALVFTDCVISGNRAEVRRGGGFNCGGGTGLLLTNCTISDNSSALSGGGFYARDLSATLIDCTIDGNATSDGGGGVFLITATASIERCSIADNVAMAGGGGLRCIEGSDLSIRNTRIRGNRSGGRGGGLICDGANSIGLMNCLVSANISHMDGGGAYALGTDSLLISNCTFTENSAAGAGGGAFFDSTDVSIDNSILWDDAPQELISQSGPLVVRYSNVEGAWTGVGNIDQAPRLAAKRFFYPRRSSPCIDAGDPELSDAVHDQFPWWPAGFQDGERADIGAYGGPGNAGWLPLF